VHKPNTPIRPIARERGVVLIVSLVLLLILTMISVTVARLQTVEERMAQNINNRQLAMEAAEATLRDVEFNVRQALPGFTDFSGGSAGLYTLIPANGSVLSTINWTLPAQTLTSVVIAGPPLAAVMLNQQPVAIAEMLPAVCWPGDNCSMKTFPQQVAPTFRVTSRGYGADTTATITVQSIVH
jgi:type IV pilus assembly protein PilX